MKDETVAEVIWEPLRNSVNKFSSGESRKNCWPYEILRNRNMAALSREGKDSENKTQKKNSHHVD